MALLNMVSNLLIPNRLRRDMDKALTMHLPSTRSTNSLSWLRDNPNIQDPLNRIPIKVVDIQTTSLRPM